MPHESVNGTHCVVQVVGGQSAVYHLSQLLELIENPTVSRSQPCIPWRYVRLVLIDEIQGRELIEVFGREGIDGCPLQAHQHEAGGVPELVAERSGEVHSLLAELDVLVLTRVLQKIEPEGIRAVFVDQVERVHAVAEA